MATVPKLSTTMPRPILHSRHIPREHLDFEVELARTVLANGLCDALEPDSLRYLRDAGVRAVETRLTWWELEPSEGRFDWSRIDRDAQKISDAGLEVGIFPWWQHPPRWYCEQAGPDAFYRCLEHGESSSILSLWAPGTLATYDRLYQALAERYGEILDFIYVGISGDFGEVVYPHGIKHYLFSPKHNHDGFWCGDGHARVSWQSFLRSRYASISDLNAAWETNLTGWEGPLMPEVPMEKNNLRCRVDFMDWCTGSLLAFMESVCQVVRKHLPTTRAAVPIGFPGESLHIGQIKSQAVRIAAHYRMDARWSGLGMLEPFAKENVRSKRISTAARFYGTGFGTEAGLIIEPEIYAKSMYESLANGASMIHDDIGNLRQNPESNPKTLAKLVVDPPVCEIAVFYPLESEILGLGGIDMDEFFRRGAALRAVDDYEICDSFMVRDGFYEHFRISDVLFLTDTVLPDDVVEETARFIERGGRAWLYRDAAVAGLRNGKALPQLVEQADIPVFRVNTAGGAGLYYCDDLPQLPPYRELAEAVEQGPNCYITVHRNSLSVFRRDQNTFDILPKPAQAKS